MPESSQVTAGVDIYAGDMNKLRQDIMLGRRISESKAAAASTTVDLSDVTKGSIKTVNLDQDLVLTFSGVAYYPTIFFVRFVQDGTGGHALTISQTGVRYPGGSAPVISQGANEVTGFLFIVNGATDWDCYYAGFNLLVPA